MLLTMPSVEKRTVPKRRVREREHLLPAEVEKLIREARADRHGVRDSCLFLVMFRHGLRAQEALPMKWSQVDFDNAVLHVRRLKNGMDGDHPISGVELRALRHLKREGPRAGDFVFVGERGHPLTTRGLHGLLERVAIRAGLGGLNIHPHCFRHACGYRLADEGIDLRVIKDWLGHREIRHTVRYTQLSPRKFEGIWTD